MEKSSEGEDLLLEKYLDELDRYVKAQEALGSSMSSAFLNLAKANQTTSPYSRYGRDMYDERVKAVRTVELESKGEGAEEKDTTKSTVTRPFVVIESKPESGRKTNPVTMFGVLVPASLRQAQTDFAKGVEAAVNVANALRSLNALEAEIKEARGESTEVSVAGQLGNREDTAKEVTEPEKSMSRNESADTQLSDAPVKSAEKPAMASQPASQNEPHASQPTASQTNYTPK